MKMDYTKNVLGRVYHAIITAHTLLALQRVGLNPVQ